MDEPSTSQQQQSSEEPQEQHQQVSFDGDASYQAARVGAAAQESIEEIPMSAIGGNKSPRYKRREQPVAPTTGAHIIGARSSESAVMDSGQAASTSSATRPPNLSQHRHSAPTMAGTVNAAYDDDAESERGKQQQMIMSLMSTESSRRHYAEDLIINPAESESNKFCEGFLLAISIFLFAITFPIAILFAVRVVQEYERAVIFRLGHLITRKPRGPGIFFIMPCIDRYVLVDLRTHTHDVEPQEILTKDSVTVTVDAVVYYRVVNPILAVVRVADYEKSIDLVSVSILRNVLGTRTLTDLLGERDTVSLNLQNLLDDVTEHWGVKVERVEIKNVQLPVQLQRAMATEAEAAREALARVIAAEGEHKASHALKKAADIIAESPGALQLRYMQTLAAISSEKNSTIIFPVPVELLNLLPSRPHHSTHNDDRQQPYEKSTSAESIPSKSH